MRILVLQLARFGDIYQTWPVLRALRKKHPLAQIHLLVRERFAAATEGLDEVDHVHILKTSDILRPLIEEETSDAEDRMNESLDQIDELLKSMTYAPFDRIINLSFSPFSSYLTRALSSERTRVAGYTRHTDGGFYPADDMSAYFLAQVGVGGYNHLHLLEIFARVAEVELSPEDFRAPVIVVGDIIRDKTKLFFESTNVLAVQLFASSAEKSLSVDQWKVLVPELLAHTNARLLLLGGPMDLSAADEITQAVASDRVLSLVGKTEIRDVFWLLRHCRGLLAPDSVTVHMASLTQTPTVNLSFASVNAWETGPWVPGSRVVYAFTPADLQIQNVVSNVVDILQGLNTTWDITPPLYEHQLLSALYFASPFPMTSTRIGFEAFARIREIMHLALEQCAALLSNSHSREAMIILNQIDDLLGAVRTLAPDLEPLFRWYQAEQLRVRPGTLSEIIVQTRDVYERLLGWSELGCQVPNSLKDGGYDVDSPMVEL